MGVPGGLRLAAVVGFPGRLRLFGRSTETISTEARPESGSSDSFRMSLCATSHVDKVTKFTKRTLTHESDVLNVFAGIVANCGLGDFPFSYWALYAAIDWKFLLSLLWAPTNLLQRRREHEPDGPARTALSQRVMAGLDHPRCLAVSRPSD